MQEQNTHARTFRQISKKLIDANAGLLTLAADHPKCAGLATMCRLLDSAIEIAEKLDNVIVEVRRTSAA